MGEIAEDSVQEGVLFLFILSITFQVPNFFLSLYLEQLIYLLCRNEILHLKEDIQT